MHISRGKVLGNGKAILYLMDNNDLDIYADALVSDPPYGINFKRGGNSSSSISTTGKVFQRKIRGDNTPFDPTRWLIEYNQVAFTGVQYYYDRMPAGGMIHCWDKRGNYKPLDQADADMIWVRSDLKRAYRPRVFHLVWRGLCRHSENKEKILHPTQKPIALMAWILELLKLSPGDKVYDPYMGVGTTGVAAIQAGYRFIGAEIEPEYFNHAVTRIGKAIDDYILRH